MKSGELNRLLDDSLTVDDFKAIIAGEVEDYRRLMDKRGSTINLRLYEDEVVPLDKFKFRKLLDFVIDGRLSNIHLAYICDCLTMADNVTTDGKTKEMIFEIADPEINSGYLDKETLKNMSSKIQ